MKHNPRHNVTLIPFARLLLVISLLLSAVYTTHAERTAKHKNFPQRMAYLENDHVKVGVDLNLGGAITYLSDKKHNINMINSWDWGRQIQMSFYSGPNPYTLPNKKPAKVWAKLGWNPIQVGDHFGNPAKLITHRVTPKEIYIKSRPKLWPMNNVPARCTFEIWLKLQGPAVIVKCRLNNAREDKKLYSARHQELPAVYTNAPYYRLYSYTGNKPYTNDVPTLIHGEKKPLTPWTHWYATEKWAALVNDQGYGVGLYQPAAHHYLGGFGGQPGPGGPKDVHTGYFAPLRSEFLDHNIQYTYNYHLLVGNLKSIRQYVYQQVPKLTPPIFTFTKDRQGFFSKNARDAGWPIQNHYEVHFDLRDDPWIESPDSLWHAKDAPVVVIHAAIKTKQSDSQVMFQKHNDKTFAGHVVGFKVIGDGKFRKYKVNLNHHPNYDGLLKKLRIDPVGLKEANAWIKIKSIHFESTP